jgi:hypothetical protein
MLLNFITAVAWLWGSICALGVIVMPIPTQTMPSNPKAAAEFLLLGLPAWAWLLARYCP